MAEVDLDRLATGYRHRPASVASLERAAAAGSALEPGEWVLDVGGGPGNHSTVWRDQGLRAVVLDPSAAMMASASHSALLGVRGRSQDMPFSSRRFALVWFHLSIHYGDWRAAIDESVRVADERGSIEIWTLGPDHHERSMLAQWFPSVAHIDTDRFPHPESLAGYLSEQMPTVSTTHPVESVSRSAGSWLAAVEAGFISTLQLVPNSERVAGIEAFRSAHPDLDEPIEYQLRFTRITATGR